jgi:sRNA-binding protein
MASVNHVHTYYTTKKRERIFYCADPYCTHRLDRKLLVGKASKCNLCGNEFILTRQDLERAKPRCQACSQTKQAKAIHAASAVFQQAIQDAFEKQQQKAQTPEPLPEELDVEVELEKEESDDSDFPDGF